MSEDFKTTIGLEIHAQLKTKSKMFCSCDNNAEAAEPNTLVCPICLGMPGTLPTPNKEAILMAVKLGLALGAKICEESKFDRKHYFYPDLPKGYQISQYDQPFCVGGELLVGDKIVKLNRIHLEEDAGKLLHPEGANYSVVDLNRAGTPLLEIVTEPDITTPLMAKEFMQELREILRALQISDADMEKGHLRCDANISVSRQSKMSPIIEIKNLNSFKFVEKALIYEEKRLKEEYDSWPAKKTKITRGYDAKAGQTYILREKEEAKDYRYFPEPDIPPIKVHEIFSLEEIRKNLPAMPSEVRSKINDWGLDKKWIEQIAKNPHIYNLLEKVREKDSSAVSLVGKILIHEEAALDMSIDNLIYLAQLILEKEPPSNIVRKIIEKSVSSNENPKLIYDREFSMADIDVDEVVEKILSKNSDAVSKIKSGKEQVIGFLVGEVMRETKGNINPNIARQIIIKKINSIK